MSGITQCQSVFRVVKNDASSQRQHTQTARRNRQHVSCAPCIAKKTKCDRQIPCSSCSRRRETTSCRYSDDGHQRPKSTDKTKHFEAQWRLQRLENMVMALMESNNRPQNTGLQPVSSAETSVNGVAASTNGHSLQSSDKFPGGHLNINGGGTSYVGGTNWAAILENIRGVREVLEPTQLEQTESQNGEASAEFPDIILGNRKSLTLEDVLQALPSRAVADDMLSVFFNSKRIQIPILHTGTFLRQYGLFWNDAASVSFLWISMLFSALYIGSSVQHANQDPTSAFMRDALLQKAAECLLSGEYDKLRQYSAESLFLYAYCHYLRKEDSNADAWMLIGLSTRLAMRMGYHRDPSHFPGISPFEGEMRRRTFFMVEAFDLLLSFQAGLPAVIHEEQCDTEPPRNLFDTDFNEECKAIPPSRPLTDSTPMLYFHHKSRLLRVFRRIARCALSPKPPTYDYIMSLDAELRKVHADAPPSIRLTSLRASFADPPHVVLHKLNVELLYLKSLCVLHRNYHKYNRAESSFSKSRSTCTEAALQTLGFLTELPAACQPGGPLHEDRWMLSSLARHDFLLAAMIICLDLHESHSSTSVTAPESEEMERKKYNALVTSYEFWTSRKGFSKEARRASDVLSTMLSKLLKLNLAHDPLADLRLDLQDFQSEGTAQDTQRSPEASIWNTSRPESNLMASTSAAGTGNVLEANPPELLDTMVDFNQPENIDWGLLDKYFVGQPEFDELLNFD